MHHQTLSASATISAVLAITAGKLRFHRHFSGRILHNISNRSRRCLMSPVGRPGGINYLLNESLNIEVFVASLLTGVDISDVEDFTAILWIGHFGYRDYCFSFLNSDVTLCFNAFKGYFKAFKLTINYRGNCRLLVCGGLGGGWWSALMFTEIIAGETQRQQAGKHSVCLKPFSTDRYLNPLSSLSFLKFTSH